MNKIDFNNVSIVGLESSPVAKNLAGLKANEARYIWNKYKKEFFTSKPEEDIETLNLVNKVLLEKDMVFSYKPLEVAHFQIDDDKFYYVFYENGLVVNIVYSTTIKTRRAVGFKLSEGIEIPKEFEGKFKFGRSKSKLAGIIRGTYFIIKKEY